MTRLWTLGRVHFLQEQHISASKKLYGDTGVWTVEKKASSQYLYISFKPRKQKMNGEVF